VGNYFFFQYGHRIVIFLVTSLGSRIGWSLQFLWGAVLFLHGEVRCFSLFQVGLVLDATSEVAKDLVQEKRED
jgi:hypothetical protein